MSQLMSMMRDITRQIGTSIPSNTENNPQKEENEHVKAITLYLGKVLNSPETLIQEETRESAKDLQEDPRKADKYPKQEKVTELAADPKKESTKDLAITQVPFPSRLEERQKRDADEFVSFLNLFKTLNVNLPLIELIEKVPEHRKIKAGEQVNMNTSCNPIISRQVPQKLKEPGKRIHFNRALCDLGASINLKPLFVCEKLGLGDLKNTQITLQLAEKSLVHPKGVLEDVLVKIHSFIIPTDFVVLDFKEDQEIPILLGRPFLATSRFTIDLEKK
ncbi:bromodomain-containing protein [Gossypium australe]|uniref:Bromodomain-containing protein n=1 Tax=Gossypium australe TaxID=47621 RepID=A0A5B6VXU0_9ROSI|nr:bromodomain-containing protein [Gossypium australe]